MVQQDFANHLYELNELAQKDEKRVLLFLDPMHQVHNNENDYCWQFKGKDRTKVMESNTGRRRLNIVGALNAVSLSPTVILTEGSCTSEVIEALLREIREEYKDAKEICIVLDNASYQRACSVQVLAKELDIRLLYLPAYCPNLNLIERLWKFFKKHIIKNKYYKAYKEFEDAVIKFFADYDKYKDSLNQLLRFKFGIIKAI